MPVNPEFYILNRLMESRFAFALTKSVKSARIKLLIYLGLRSGYHMNKILTTLLLSLSLASYAKNQIVVISGGDDPGLNHYSQYLQTKTLYDYLISIYGQDMVSIYFGAGNNPATQTPLLDVHKIESQTKNDLMLPGIIANNQMASKSNILSYFMLPKIQNLSSTENLLVFVSDHGMPYAFMEDKNANPNSNNCIDLWNYQKPFIENFANAKDFYNVCLSKNELAAVFTNLSAKHVIFEMSQCYSGGFHQLSVKLKRGYPTANPKICGFTASPPDHYASGCTADANGDTYKGYERSFTEWYTGKSILTGQSIHEPAKTMGSAHQNAVLEDMTVDVPLTTSDYYLMLWAELIMDPQFISRVNGYSANETKTIYENYPLHRSKVKDADFLNFTKLAQDSQSAIIKIMPHAAGFSALPLTKQVAEINSLEKQIQQEGADLDSIWDGMMALYLKVIMPAWDNAVNAHQVNFLSPKQYQFEKEFYQVIVQQGLYKRPYQFEMLYLQYLSSKNNDADLIRYLKERNGLIIKWAEKNQQHSVLNAMKNFQTLDKKQQELLNLIAFAERNKQFLKRIMTYNKIIAAWVTLTIIQDKEALDDLQGLLDCQHSG